MKPKKYPIKDEIIYLKSYSNYTIYCLKNGMKFISSETLKQTQANLRLSLFLRVNKSHLVNHNFIDSVTKERTSFIIKLSDKTQFKVSRLLSDENFS